MRVPCWAMSSGFGSTSAPSGSNMTGRQPLVHSHAGTRCPPPSRMYGRHAARRSREGSEARSRAATAGRRDGDLAASRRVRTPPFLEELRHEAVEELVGSAPGLDCVVVDVAERHRRPDRVRSLRVCPATPGNEQRPLGVRVQVVHPLEQPLSLQLLRATCREHDRDRCTLLSGGLELTQRRFCRRAADDPIVARIC
jgi:hypothetical protein